MFEDDFSHDVEGNFPSYWEIEPYHAKVMVHKTNKRCKVHKIDDKYAMFIRNVWLEKEPINENQIESISFIHIFE